MRARPFNAVLALLAVWLVSACAVQPVVKSPPAAGQTMRYPAVSPQTFLEVAQNVEPVAERVCRTETPDQNCDFAILVDRDPESGVNAFQTLDGQGRPIIILTLGLVAVLDNEDELAFVLGHEAGHHIARHIPEQRHSAAEGARVFGEIAMAGGADARGIERAAELGAFVGARSYSRSAELEADAIGTVIAFGAGYDPLVGARLFTRLPEPRMGLLSTHPPSADRMIVVRRALAVAQAGG